MKTISEEQIDKKISDAVQIRRRGRLLIQQDKLKTKQEEQCSCELGGKWDKGCPQHGYLR